MGGKSKQTSETKIDPAVQGLQLGNYSRAEGIANTPVTPYGQSLDLSQSMGAARGLLDFTAPDATSQGYTASLMNRGDIRDISTAAATPEQIRGYYNPYETDVVNGFLDDNERQRQMAISNGQAQAMAQGAFGGSRHGVADSLTSGEYARTGASFAAGLRNQGYQTAIGAVQGDQGRALQAGMANQGVDYNVSSGNTGYQNQASAFGADAANRASLANQQAALASAGVRAQGAGLLGSLESQQYGSAYDEWLRQQNDPMVKQGLLNSALGGVQAGQTTTGTKTPGMFDWANMAAQTAAAYFGGGK